MNAFAIASTVEARGIVLLLPYLKERKAFNGQCVWMAKGALARFLQEKVGDILFNTDEETVCSAEVKVEQKWTGNLFLETWSNRNLERKADHSMRGSNPGWLLKTQADALLYYFLDTDTLVTMSVFRLMRWAFVDTGRNGCAGKLYDYEERQQRKYDQCNDTWGRLVPVGDLERGVGAKRTTVRQLGFFDGQAA